MPGDNLTHDELALRTAVGDGPSGGAAGANKLWLPLWSGEVINAYDEYNMFENLITHKSLSGGFSYEFPVTGKVSLQPNWNAGVELVGGDSSSTTFKINLDKRPMAAHFETDNVDLLVTQWDYRSELARQAGLTLATARDKQIISTLIGACVAAPLNSDPRGIVEADFPAPVVVDTTTSAIGVAVSGCTETAALNILQAIENYLVNMQEKNFPINDVHCVVTPKVFQVIRALGIPRASNQFTQNPMFTAGQAYGGVGPAGFAGMNAMGDYLDYMGVKICKTNHIPRTDLSSGSNGVGEAKYNLDCSKFNIFAMIFQKEAVAGLSLMGMKVDTVQDVRRNTQFTVASMLKGTGILRPELCQILVGTTSVSTANESGEIDSRGELVTLMGANATTLTGQYAVTS